MSKITSWSSYVRTKTLFIRLCEFSPRALLQVQRTWSRRVRCKIYARIYSHSQTLRSFLIVCVRERVFWCSQGMRTRWKMARERKKKDIPESNQKKSEKENIFDIWSTFSSFSEEKKVKLIHFWIDRDVSFFFVVVWFFVCGGKKPGSFHGKTRLKFQSSPSGCKYLYHHVS